jgi:site-specific DNA-methyltransferase (adenine-specific)
MPLKKHEDVCIFYEGRPTYNPQMWKGKLKGKRIGKTVYQNRKSDMYLSSKPANLSIVKNDIYYPTTILNYPNVSRNKSIHPTQKPVELEEFLIKTYTNEGDTVLDNCAGSGTTGIAARNCNRKFILIEKEEKYYDKIIGRLNQK